MSETSAGEQNHPASPYRREQAIRDGDTAKSFELSGAIQALAAVAVGFMLLGGLAQWLCNWTEETWKQAAGNICFEPTVATQELQGTAFSLSAVMAPILMTMFFAGILAHLTQTGIVFRANSVVPDLGRAGPQKWWRHVWSMNAISLPFVGLPKTLIAFVTAGVSFWLQKEAFFGLGNLPVEQIGPEMSSLVLGVCFHVAIVLFALSLVDYALQRWSFERRIRMTDQQVRDEARMQNGDPQVMNQRRAPASLAGAVQQSKRGTDLRAVN